MSLKRIGLKLAMLATALNMCLSPVILHASCRTAVFVPGNVQGSCACASGSCGVHRNRLSLIVGNAGTRLAGWGDEKCAIPAHR